MEIHFTQSAVEDLVREWYGLRVTALPLNGYDELNFLLRTESGEMFILKIASDEHGVDFLDAQIKIINHLQQTTVAAFYQHYIKNGEQSECTRIVQQGRNYYVRILSFLEGEFWVNCPQRPAELLHDLGTFLAKTDLALEQFSHPAMHRHYVWDISTALDARGKLSCIRNHEKRRIAGYFLLQFETEVAPVLSSLRHRYIHNDANDYNLLVTDNRIAGLIDFGDMVYSALINNVAVACTYAMLNIPDPLEAAVAVVGAYHSIHPLTVQEIDLLYFLVAGRLCISVTQSAFNGSFESTNEHHFITEKPAWELLFRLIRINPLLMQHRLRTACGFASPFPAPEDHLQLEAERNTHLGRNLSISYRRHLKIVKGALQYLYDDLGNTYIDCVNNVSHAGHCHPVVVKKMQHQLATLNTNTRYLHNDLVEYAKRITRKLPSSLSVCYFTNSGSEANDLAIRMSRHFTKQQDILVLDHAYHGTSTVAIEMSPYKFDGKGGMGNKPWIHKLKNPDLYRGEFIYGDSSAGEKYAADAERVIQSLALQGKSPAAFICETLLGVGGQIPLPENYLSHLYQHVRNAGGVCIADEVQVGFGRVGTAFWGFELQHVVPDIVVLGKPIGNGHPLAAVVVSAEIADVFNNGMEYFNTFGGNPVSMATGLAVLDVIEQEEMQQHAADTGVYFLQLLSALQARHKIIGDVRGRGFFIGVELVKDRVTKEPAVPEIDDIVEKMKELGFLVSTDGPLHNVLKIKPPMVFSRENAEEFTNSLDRVLAGME